MGIDEICVLCTKQALEIDRLKKQIAEYEESNKVIYNIIYCIGGPLNDNKLRYNKKQMVDFHRIVQELRI